MPRLFSRTLAFRQRSLLGMVVFLAGGGLLAQDRDELDLEFELGYRWRSEVAGSQALYRTQVDLGEGPKLFGANLLWTRPGNQFFDRLQLRLSDWGGEPRSGLQLRVERDSLYQLRLDYRTARFFNHTPLFANPLLGEGILQSQQRYDLSLSDLSLTLELRPDSRLSPFFSWQRSRRRGPQQTTLAADGEEYLVTAEHHQDSDRLGGGVVVSGQKFSLRLEQQVQWSSDDTSWNGEPQTGNSRRPVFGRDLELESYAADLQATTTTPVSLASASWRPHRSLNLSGNFSYSIADLESRFQEEISGFFFRLRDAIFLENASKSYHSSATQPAWSGGLIASWQPFARLQIDERFNYRRTHVAGANRLVESLRGVDPLLSPAPPDPLEAYFLSDSLVSADLETQQLTASIEVARGLRLVTGHRYQRKKILLEEPHSWTRNTLLLGAHFDYRRRHRIGVDYELGRGDGVTFRTEPRHLYRLRLSGRTRPVSALQFSGSVNLFESENQLDPIDLLATTRDYSLQLDYSPDGPVSLFASYQRSRYRSDLLFVVPQDFSSGRSSYQEVADSVDFSLQWRLWRGTRVDLGYSLWSNSGSFPLIYHQPVARLEVPWGERLSLVGEWNFHNYNEKLVAFAQDYRAHLVQFGLRVRIHRSPTSPEPGQ